MEGNQLQKENRAVNPDELFEQANKEAAKLAGIKIIENHMDILMRVRSSCYEVNDDDLLSSNVNKISEIPNNAREQILTLQTKFKTIINAVAAKIEDSKYESTEEAILDMQKRGMLSGTQKNTTNQLVAADKKVHLSCQSLKITVDFFIKLNEYMIQGINDCKNSDQEHRLVLGNAILAYELSDFTLKYLQSFNNEGVSGINLVKGEIVRKISKIKTEIEDLRNKAQSDKIFPEVKNIIFSNIQEREDAVKIMTDAWDDYLGEVNNLSKETDGFISKWLPNLELIRDDAKNQISVLETMTIVKFLNGNIKDLKAVCSSLKTIPLVSLSPDRVRRLLGLKEYRSSNSKLEITS